MLFVERFRFYFVESLTIGFAIGGMESKNIDAVIDFFGWSIWNMLIIFWRWLLKMVSRYFFIPGNFSM